MVIKQKLILHNWGITSDAILGSVGRSTCNYFGDDQHHPKDWIPFLFCQVADLLDRPRALSVSHQ